MSITLQSHQQDSAQVRQRPLVVTYVPSWTFPLVPYFLISSIVAASESDKQTG